MDSNSPSAASGFARRPARTSAASALTRWVRRLTIGVTAALFLVVVVGYPTLPETVATHFGPTGQPDGWGPRSSVLVTLLILGAVIGGCTWLSHYPRLFNYPVPVTEHTADRLYLLGEQMMVWTTAGLALIAASTVASVFWGVVATPLVLSGLAITLGALTSGLVRMFRG